MSITPELQTNSDDDFACQLLVMIVRGLVDDSASVQVSSCEENGTTTLKLRVAPADTGKIIGKQGRTARSLRTVLNAAGMKMNRRYILNIAEEQ